MYDTSSKEKIFLQPFGWTTRQLLWFYLKKMDLVTSQILFENFTMLFSENDISALYSPNHEMFVTYLVTFTVFIST